MQHLTSLGTKLVNAADLIAEGNDKLELHQVRDDLFQAYSSFVNEPTSITLANLNGLWARAERMLADMTSTGHLQPEGPNGVLPDNIA